MALGKNTRHAPKRVAEMRDYWRIYRRNAILLSLLTQLLVALVVGGALIVAGAHIDALPFIVTMGATITGSFARFSNCDRARRRTNCRPAARQSKFAALR